jgi:hypothetical protein
MRLNAIGMAVRDGQSRVSFPKITRNQGHILLSVLMS